MDPRNPNPPDEPRREEELLDALGSVAREKDAEARRRFGELRRLAAGELSDDEVEALRAASEKSEEARLDFEAFRPLDEDFDRRMVEAIRARAGEGNVETEDAGPVDIASRRPRSARPWTGLGALAAVLLVAVAAIYLLPSLRQGPSFDLPAYEAELEGDIQDVRGPEDPERRPRFALGDTLRLTLTPERTPDEEPQVAFYLVDENDDVGEWRVGYERTADGAIRIEGTLGDDLPVEPGSYVFVMVYGRPGDLPDPRRADELEPTDGDPWRVLRVPFRVEAGEIAALPLEVGYAGCYRVYHDIEAGTTCVPFLKLTLWARTTAGAQLTVWVHGQPLDDAGTAVDGGRRFVFPVEKIDGKVEVVATTPSRESRFRLGIRPSDEPPWLIETRRAARRGEIEAARRQLLDGLEHTPEPIHGSIYGMLARLADTDEERIERLETAVERYRAHGELMKSALDLGMLLHLDEQARRFGRMRARLDDFYKPNPGSSPGRNDPAFPGRALALLGYYRGILENDVGNFRGALAALRESADVARRLGLTQELAAAEAQLGLVLQRLGRGDEAVEQLRSLEAASFAETLSTCERARLSNSLAWIQILAEGRRGDPLPALDRATELASGGECDDGLRLDVLLNRALALTLDGRGAEAYEALARSDELDHVANALHRLWRQDVEGRLALADDRPEDALDHYREMEELAGDAFEPRSLWWANVQRGIALDRLGEAESALEAFAQAELRLDDQTLRVPLDAGRESFTADTVLGTRRYVDLLLRRGFVEEALDVSRRARARTLNAARRGHRLAQLDSEEQATWDLEIAEYRSFRARIEEEAADDWRLSSAQRAATRARREELRRDALQALDRAFRVLGPEGAEAPPPSLRHGELLLAFHPLPGDEWAVFAARPGRVESRRIELPEPTDSAELSRRILSPVAETLKNAERLRVLPYGRLASVDFHTLPWGDGILLEHLPVVYGLDLRDPAAAGFVPRASDHGASALVIGDPLGDLPAARSEVESVEAALRESSFTVERLVGDRADRTAVLDGLERVDLAHYAGHGVSAGRFGWESALRLARDEQLQLGDVIALGRAPSWVVLSSCESGRTVEAASAGLGLAQAFLVAGAERVIAATRPVGDADSSELFRRLYAGGGPLGGAPLDQRLRRAQLAWHDADPSADWASFRLLEP